MSEPTLNEDCQLWMQAHSHAGLFKRIRALEQDLAGLRLYCIAALEGLAEQLAALDEHLQNVGNLADINKTNIARQDEICKQCYLESKGEGP